MGIKNAIGSLFGLISLAVASILPLSAKAQGNLECYNYSPASGVRDNYMKFVNGLDGDYLPEFSPSMEIWYGPATNKHSVAGVDVSNSKTYDCPLAYQGTIPNGATNYLRYHFFTQFPSNMVFTYLVDANGKKRPGDVRKQIVESPLAGYGKEYLDNVSNAVSGQIYGTNWVNIAPIETTIRKLEHDAGANECALHADVRPGTISWPEFTDDLTGGSWTGLTNYPNRKYAAVTTNNFGGVEGLVWRNLPGNSTKGTRFWRIQNAVYDPAYTNGLVQDGGYEETNTLASVKSMQSARDSKKSERIIRFK